MRIKTEEQYRVAVKRYLELSEYAEGTPEYNEAALLSKAMDSYETSQLESEKEKDSLRNTRQN
jgi:hypothetical protein